MIDTKQKAKDILEEYANSYSQVDLEHLTEHLDSIRAEAIKEFAERLKSEMIGKFCSHFDGELTNAIIDKVLKEMVGDDK